MKRFLLMTVVMVISGIGYSQSKIVSTKKIGVLTIEGAEFALTAMGDGKYCFSYRNGMGKSKDTCKIIFKSKKEAEGFINKIGQAFSAKDGTSFYISYPGYKIRLLTEMTVVFMIVNEREKEQSTFRITKENYQQVNVL
jgi:hypothetical protein